MEEKINQALVQLENDLQSLVSARKQVETTVKASSELQKVVGDYVSSVKSLCVGLQSWKDNLKSRESSLGHDVETAISNIKRICEEIVSSFAGKADNIKTSFLNDTNEALDKFVDQNNILAERVEGLTALREQIKKATEEIESFKNSLGEMSKELKESQEEQDVLLDDIKQKALELPTTILNETQSIINSVEQSKTTLIGIINNTNIIIDRTKTKVNNLNTNIDALNTLCQNLNSSIISINRSVL